MLKRIYLLIISVIFIFMLISFSFAQSGDVGLVKQIVPPPSSYPSYSPDGSKIAMSIDGDIFVFTPENNERIQVTSEAIDESFPSWSPDGSKICFRTRQKISDGADEYNIWIIDESGQNRTQITESGNYTTPDWSPDSSSIVAKSTLNNQIVVIDITTGNIREVTKDMISTMNPKWSPDGTKIVYGGKINEDNYLSIWIISADGTDNREIIPTDDK